MQPPNLAAVPATSGSRALLLPKCEVSRLSAEQDQLLRGKPPSAGTPTRRPFFESAELQQINYIKDAIRSFLRLGAE